MVQSLRSKIKTNKPRRSLMVAAAVAGTAFAASLGAWAAKQGETPAPPVIKVTSEVVNVYAVVRGKHGRLVPDLTKKDFEITDDGVPQTIKYFSRATKTPLTLALLVDTSPSQERVLGVEKEEAKAFLQQVLRKEDMACVVHFDLEVGLLQDFTEDLVRLDRGIDSAVINGGAYGPTPGTFPDQSACCTYLYNAVYLASHSLLSQQIGRKVIILLTDGQDAGSTKTLRQALNAAQRADVIIYSLDISDPSFYGGGFAFEGDSVLRQLSNQTGGHVVDIRRAKQMSEAFAEIAEELRTQYQLGFVPNPAPTGSSFHRLEVHVINGHYKVQARRGYYARPQ